MKSLKIQFIVPDDINIEDIMMLVEAGAELETFTDKDGNLFNIKNTDSLVRDCLMILRKDIFS